MKQVLAKVILVCLAMLIVVPFQSVTAAGATVPETANEATLGTIYYVDTNGSDTNTGKSEEQAWQSLDKLNTTTFLPGDKILFKAGGEWTGSLQPKGSGEPNKRIVISSYGDGAKPILQGAGVENTIKFYNQQHWEVGHLEITNKGASAATSPRRGLLILAENFGVEGKTETDLTQTSVLRDFYIHDLFIHDVNGQDKKDGDGSAGIQVSVRIPGMTSGLKVPAGSVNQRTTFDQIVIENNKISNVDRSGIIFWSDWLSRDLLRYKDTAYGDKKDSPWTPMTNVVIRANKLENIGGDGIAPHMTEGVLVEYNFIDGYNVRSSGYSAGMWLWNGDHALFQFNEATGGKTTRDGMPWDFDQGTQGTIYQYNYSYNNEGGTLLFCTENEGHGVKDGVFRYNISQNDKYQIFTVCGGSAMENVQVYNNVFYVGAGMNTAMMVSQGGSVGVKLYNNVFINHGTGGYASKPSWTYFNNAFFGNKVPTKELIPDSFMVTGDPKLMDAGKAKTVLNQKDVINPAQINWFEELSGYKLLADSPLINAGRFISVTGDPGNRDFYNNPLYNGMPDIGVHEYELEKYPNVDPFEPVIPKPKTEILNGDFENTKQHGNGAPWSWQWNGGIINDGNAYEGEYAGYTKAITGGASVEQEFAVTPNTKYKLSAYVRAGDDKQTLYLVVQTKNKAVKKTEELIPVTSTEYKKFTYEFTTAADIDKALVSLYKEKGTAVKNYFDNVSIEEVIPVDISALEHAKAEAVKLLNDTKVGTAAGEVPQSAKDALQAAIAAAQSVLDEEAAEQSEVDAETTSLNEAVKVFKAAIIIQVTPPADSSALEKAKAEAVKLLNDTNVGTAAGQVPQSAKDALQAAIAAAQIVLDDESANQSAVDSATTNLNVAIKVFKAAIINQETPPISPVQVVLDRLIVEQIPAALQVGDTAQAKVTALYTDGIKSVVTAEASFSSSDASVVEVSAQGAITAKGAGTAVITVSYKGKSQTVEIIVKASTNPGTNPGTGGDTPKFTDIAKHWANAAITGLAADKLMNGYGKGSFKPDQSMTRAELTALLIRALKQEPKQAAKKGYKDVATNHWAKGYIDTAVELGIVKGITEQTFGPEASISRQEFAVMIARAYKWNSSIVELNFTDKAEIAPWAAGAVQVLVEKGIMQGYPNGSFKAEQAVTRAEAASMIAKLLEL